MTTLDPGGKWTLEDAAIVAAWLIVTLMAGWVIGYNCGY